MADSFCKFLPAPSMKWAFLMQVLLIGSQLYLLTQSIGHCQPLFSKVRAYFLPFHEKWSPEDLSCDHWKHCLAVCKCWTGKDPAAYELVFTLTRIAAVALKDLTDLLQELHPYTEHTKIFGNCFAWNGNGAFSKLLTGSYPNSRTASLS